MKLTEHRIQQPQMTNNMVFQKWFRKITKQANNTQKAVSTKMKGSSDFQNEHIKYQKCPVFKKKYYMGHSQKKIIEIIFEKTQPLDLVEKYF